MFSQNGFLVLRRGLLNSNKSIGIIANPASGKDIRRMISYAVSIDNTDKVKIVQQIILSASSMGVEKIYFMPEYYGIFQTALKNISYTHQDAVSHIEAIPTHSVIIGNQDDTITATKIMVEEQVSCIVTLGGDGTNRVIAKNCADIPLIPISTGTNNVFPKSIQGTAAGTAAGIFSVANLIDQEKFTQQTKRIEIWNEDELLDIALIDAVVIDDVKTASRAMWGTEDFEQVFLTSSKLGNIGISSMGAALKEISETEDKGLYVQMDDEAHQYIHFPIAPGLFSTVSYSHWQLTSMDEFIPIKAVPSVIALDGEKDFYVRPGMDLKIKITQKGPKTVHIDNVLKEGSTRGLLVNGDKKMNYKHLISS